MRRQAELRPTGAPFSEPSPAVVISGNEKLESSDAAVLALSCAAPRCTAQATTRLATTAAIRARMMTIPLWVLCGAVGRDGGDERQAGCDPAELPQRRTASGSSRYSARTMKRCGASPTK
jgi:hypothetical protein